MDGSKPLCPLLRAPKPQNVSNIDGIVNNVVIDTFYKLLMFDHDKLVSCIMTSQSFLMTCNV